MRSAVVCLVLLVFVDAMAQESSIYDGSSPQEQRILTKFRQVQEFLPFAEDQEVLDGIETAGGRTLMICGAGTLAYSSLFFSGVFWGAGIVFIGDSTSRVIRAALNGEEPPEKDRDDTFIKFVNLSVAPFRQCAHELEILGLYCKEAEKRNLFNKGEEIELNSGAVISNLSEITEVAD